MSAPDPIWLTEADVVSLMNLPQAIDALETGLRRQAEGSAKTMDKTHMTWDGGSTLHAIGAVYETRDIVGAKTWAHTAGGASPLLLLWNASTGALLAVIEAFAMGQMRTGGVSGVAARWMSAPDADSMALIGTGKQALAQLAAVAAVRPLRSVRIWGRDPGRRDALAAKAAALGYGFDIQTPATVAEATDGAAIVTLVTRAREPFFTAAMAAPGAHINAVGAITPEREEFTPDILDRAALVVADDPGSALRLSREFSTYFPADTARILPLSTLVGHPADRAQGGDLTVFKAMGMGLSDLALGIELHAAARTAGLGRSIPAPVRAAPRLTAI